MGPVSGACRVDCLVSVGVFVFVYEHTGMSVFRGFTVTLVLWTHPLERRWVTVAVRVTGISLDQQGAMSQSVNP